MKRQTHIISPLAPSRGHGQFIALCGSLVYGSQDTDGVPTCEECAQRNEDETKSLRELQAWNDELTAQGK
jgi:hypothetical protein